MLKATKNEGEPRERPNTGNIQAVCTAVRDVGIQESAYNGKVKYVHKIVIVWELAQTISEGKFAGKRMVQSQKYTLSMWDKALLRQHLESWRGKKFKDEDEACAVDLEKLVGVNCLLNLQESDDGKYINIAGISPILKGMEPMKPELPPDHEYKWIDELAAKAVKVGTDAEAPQREPVKPAAPADTVMLKEGEDPFAGEEDAL